MTDLGGSGYRLSGVAARLRPPLDFDAHICIGNNSVVL